MTELQLLKFAVKSHPQLWHAVQITMRVTSSNLQFPIESHDALFQAFDAGADRVELEDVSFTKAQVEAFFPVAFYPVANEEDLFGKMYAALLHGSSVHEMEAKLRAARKFVRSARAR